MDYLYLLMYDQESVQCHQALVPAKQSDIIKQHKETRSANKFKIRLLQFHKQSLPCTLTSTTTNVQL